MMFIVYDEAKRLANFDKHGLDFDVFEEAFDFKTAVPLPTKPSHTGRERFLLIGIMDGRLVVAVVSPLGSEALSLVSLRRAKPRERKVFDGT